MKLPSCAATVIARKLTTSKYSEQEEMSIETVYPQDIEFKASVTLETHRIPDPYHYYFKDGKLYSPITNEPVEKDILRRDAVEEAEYQAFRKIQGWSVGNEEGIVVWISPPSSRDESAKIIISQIIYEADLAKKLLNRNVCFSWSSQECLTFAKKVGNSDIDSAEQLRGGPLFLDEQQARELVRMIREYSPGQARLIETEEDFRIKERLKARIALGYPAPMGPFNPSCGKGTQSAFNVMFGDSLDVSEASFDCPKCHRPIPSGKGITVCPHCGARKEDYQSGCD